MADGSLEVQKDEVPFHTCLTPRGMTWYDLNVLTPQQQKLLNELKVDVIRENNQYLAKHPEIRAIISLFVRAVLKHQPKIKTIAEFAREHFCRRESIMQNEIDDYLKERGEPKVKEATSALNLDVGSPVIPSSEDLTTFLRPEYFSYLSLTTEESSVEEPVAWSEYEDIRHFVSTTTFDKTLYSSTSDEDKSYKQRQFDKLFSSKATTMYEYEYFGEGSVEASTIDLTKEYMAFFGGPPAQDTSSEEVLDADDQQASDEIKMAETIQGKLSVILENKYEEEDEEYYEEGVSDKPSNVNTEIDVESSKDKRSPKSSVEMSEDDDEFKRTNSPANIVETIQDYEAETGG